MNIPSTYEPQAARRWGWMLLAFCALTLCCFLGETLFNTRGEPREAVVALSMIEKGNWVLPINNGVDMAYKPPFFHWLAALCSLLTGGVTEYATRLPSALGLTAMALGTYAFYARRRGVMLALLTALLTLTNFEVHRAGVACRVDMVLSCMMVLALFALYRWVERGMKGLPLLGILCLSGAFLSKGPVGLALPCLVAAAFAWIRGKGFWRVTGKFVLTGLLALLLPAVWYVAAYEQGGERFLHLVYEENVLRLLGKMTYESHVNPWPYNVMTVLTGFAPYTLLVLFSLFALTWRKPSLCPTPSTWWTRLKERIGRMDDVRLYSLLSFAIIFVFYCIPKSKRSVYLLPIYPFLAYFLAEYVMWLRHNHQRVIRWFNRLLATLALLLTMAFSAVRAGLVPESIFGHGSHAAQNAAMLAALRDTPLDWLQVMASAVPLLTVLAAWHWHKRMTAGMVGMVAGIFFALDGVFQPLVLNVKSDKPQAEFIARLQPTGRIYSFRKDVVEGNPMHPFTINYYLADRVVPFEAFRPEAGYLIVGNDEIDDFKQRHPLMKVRLVKDFEHRSCDDHKMLKLYYFSTR